MRQGQHYNQAAYTGRFHGITNFESKPGREIPVRVIETKKILELKNNQFSKNELKEQLKLLVIEKAAEKIFSGTFLLKSVEEKEEIGLLEDKFLSSCDQYPFEDLFNKNSKIFDLTADYFSLHEARNLENFSFVKKQINVFLNSNQNINEFIENTYFFNELNTKNQKDFVKKCLRELKTQKIIKNNQLFQKKIKEIFNFIYVIVWKKLRMNFQQKNWFVIELGTCMGTGNNLVLNFKKPLYKNYKEICSYLWLPSPIKEIIDNSVIIFIGDNKIALGANIKIEDFPIDLFVKNYNYIHRFLTSLCLAHSYKYIIITDDLQLDFLINAFTLDFEAFIKGIEETNLILD